MASNGKYPHHPTEIESARSDGIGISHLLSTELTDSQLRTVKGCVPVDAGTMGDVPDQYDEPNTGSKQLNHWCKQGIRNPA